MNANHLTGIFGEVVRELAHVNQTVPVDPDIHKGSGTMRFSSDHTPPKGDKDKVPIDHTWLQNDGVVNTRSMARPTRRSIDVIAPYEGSVMRGCWNDMGVMKSWDHMDIVGVSSTRKILDFYLDLAKLVSELPG